MAWTLLFFESKSIYQKSEEITKPLKHISSKKLKETKSILQLLFLELIHALEQKILLTIFLFLEKKLSFQKKYICLTLKRYFLQMKIASLPLNLTKTPSILALS